jgi:hypothetical protein
VDRSEQLASLLPLALIAPKAAKVDGGTKLPELHLLLARHINRRLIS